MILRFIVISHISERIIDCKYFFCELAISLNQHKGLQLGSVMALAFKSFLTSVLIISGLCIISSSWPAELGRVCRLVALSSHMIETTARK
jgi:hypothetical protein